MKLISPFTLFITFFFILAKVTAQSPAYYFSFEFLRIAPEQEQLFLELDQKMEKTFKQAIAERAIINRAMIKLWYPGLQSAGYNYLTVTTYPSFDKLENTSIEIVKTFHNDEQETEVNQYRSLYQVQKKEITEVWRDLLEATSDSAKSLVSHMYPGRFMLFQYLRVDPDHWDQYFNLEKETWKPIHLANIKKGQLTYWSLFGYWFEQRSIDYDLIAILIYPKFEHLKNNIYTHDVWSEVHGAEAGDQIFKDTFTFRKEVYAEVWKVLSVIRQ